MTNHYHLLLETTQPNISRIMQYINTSYTVYYNIKRNRCGHLFQGRYKSIIVDKDNYLLELTRYIHLNPVRAKITNNPLNYKWSSYREYIRKPKTYSINREQLDKYFKMSPNRYQNFVQEGINQENNLFADIYAGFILGKEKFIKEKLKDLKLQIESNDFSYKKAISCPNDPNTIINLVAAYYQRDPEIIRKAKKKPLLAKKIAIYLLKKYTQLKNTEIGKEFGISYSAVSKAMADAERLTKEDVKVKKGVEKIISHFKV
jgi:hypothetical protein